MNTRFPSPEFAPPRRPGALEAGTREEVSVESDPDLWVIGASSPQTDSVVAVARRVFPKSAIRLVPVGASTPEGATRLFIAHRRDEGIWAALRKAFTERSGARRCIVATDVRIATVLRLLERARPAGLFDPEAGDEEVADALKASLETPRFIAPVHARLLGARRGVLPEQVLNPAEERALTVLGFDLDDDESASLLGLTRETIGTYRRLLRRKLSIRGRNGLFQAALNLGYTASAPGGALVPGPSALLRGAAFAEGGASGKADRSQARRLSEFR